MLAVKLIERLEQWVAGDKDGFIRKHKAAAEELVHATFGIEMLHVVGCAPANLVTC